MQGNVEAVWQRWKAWCRAVCEAMQVAKVTVGCERWDV